MSDADPYRELQRHLDALPIAFPATSSGVELRLLRRLFTPEEAQVALALSAVPEQAEKLCARLPGRTAAELAPILDRLVEKGAIFGRAPRLAAKRYSLAPLAIGMYEGQVDKITKELQEDFEAYVAEGFGAALLEPETKQMRTIPLHARFVPDRVVGRYDDARAMIAGGDGPFAARNCVCRQGRELLGEPCQRTSARRVCVMIGSTARRAAETGEARAMTKEETLALLDDAERDGLVLQPSNSQDPVFLCLCCGCCCGVLRAAKQFPNPAERLHANYQAAVDRARCIECDTCRTRCPMDALTSFDGATAVVRERCIGCGACVPTCPAEAIRLVAKAQQTVPPKGTYELYRKITTERFGVVGTAVKVGKAILGKRV
ncbi:MAG TPA: 4Fe-4S dicluster-binding protein [Anaeromyxobacter sp.]|nr:4Fe-4S dicluster-binding protein [Anaeromyxobacter sp.]